MTTRNHVWTKDRIERAIAVLRRHTSVKSALADISKEFGRVITRDALYNGLTSSGYGSIMSYLGFSDTRSREEVPEIPSVRFENRFVSELPGFEEYETPSEPPPPTSEPFNRVVETRQFEELVEIVRKYSKKGGISLETLCDELELPPRAARELVEEAVQHGITIDIAHDRLHLRPPEKSPADQPIDIAPQDSNATSFRVGVFSDLHFGSKYCLKKQLAHFVQSAHDSGIRDFFCPGDILEGCYRHAQWELTSVSWEDQAMEFLETLPRLEGMRVFFIDGNHDWTWTDRTGVESGRNLVRLAEQMGRTDLQFFGSRGALVQYGNTRIEMWHPKKGAAYALSYGLQNHIRDTAPERLPDILLTGHTHQYVKFRRSNVWALYCGTFQHGDAPYGRALGGDVSMGGLILEWSKDDDGVVRSFSDRFVLAHHSARTFDVAV